MTNGISMTNEKWKMENGKCFLLLLPSAYCRLPLLFYRQPCVFPSLHTTQQSHRVFETLFPEIKHRTGARLFGWSRTVRDNCLVTWQLLHVVEYLTIRNKPGTSDMTCVVRGLVAHINNKRLAFVNQILQLNRGDASYIVSGHGSRSAWGGPRHGR
jgi:hypothetical protein